MFHILNLTQTIKYLYFVNSVLVFIYKYGIITYRLESTSVGLKEMTGFGENNDTWAYTKDNPARFITDNHVRCELWDIYPSLIHTVYLVKSFANLLVV